MFNLQRLIQLFSQSMPFEENMMQGDMAPPDHPAMTPQDDIMSQWNQLYHPSDVASKALTAKLGQYPQRHDPTTGTRIRGLYNGMTSGIHPAGMWGGNPVGLIRDTKTSDDAYNETIDKPHINEVEDWNAQVKPLQAAAIDEDRDNTNSRMAASQIVSEKIADKRADTTAKRYEDLTRQGDEKLDVQRRRAETYDFKAKHPDWKPFVQKGGNLFFVNPQDPNMKMDTGLNSGTLSDYDKYTLGLEGDLEKIDARGEQQRATKEQGDPNDYQIVQTYDSDGKPGQVVRIHKGTGLVSPIVMPVPRATIKPDANATQQNKALNDRAKQVISEHPEWKDYIKFNEAGNFQYIEGAPEELKTKINNYIYKKGDIDLPAKRIQVIGPNGERGTILESEKGLLPTGWKVVGG